MQDSVIFRAYHNKDAKELAHIINDTWKFDEGVDNEKQAEHIGYAYLYLCMLQADFAQVAEINGHAVGVILGRTEGKRLHPWIALKEIYHSVPLLMTKAFRNMKPMFEEYDKSNELLDRMTGVAEKKFDAELALFIVSKKARGRGVGLGLFQRLNQFFSEQGVEHYYLHTDTACSYAFYEKHGLQRLGEVQTEISYAGVDHVKMFVYGK